MTTPVKFPVAKLLKEEGYHKLSSWYYYPSAFSINDVPRLIADGANDDINTTYYDGIAEGRSLHLYNYNSKDSFYSAPSISEVVMWLYEKYGIWIGVHHPIGSWHYRITNTIEGFDLVYFSDAYKSPTEAYEAAIEYCLSNLI